MELDILKKVIFYNNKEKELTLEPIVGQSEPMEITEEQFDTLHAVMGVVTEGAELIQAMLKYLQTGELNKVNFAEELGDVSWYTNMWTERNDLQMTDILATNIKKLIARYPEKFTDFLAENRDLENEFKVLKNMHGLDEK